MAFADPRYVPGFTDSAAGRLHDPAWFRPVLQPRRQLRCGPGARAGGGADAARWHACIQPRADRDGGRGSHGAAGRITGTGPPVTAGEVHRCAAAGLAVVHAAALRTVSVRA